MTPAGFTGISGYSAVLRIRLIWFQRLASIILFMQDACHYISIYQILFLYVCLPAIIYVCIVCGNKENLSINRMSEKTSCGRKPTVHPQLVKYPALIFKKIPCGNKSSCLDFHTVWRVAVCFLIPSSSHLCIRHLHSIQVRWSSSKLWMIGFHVFQLTWKQGQSYHRALLAHSCPGKVQPDLHSHQRFAG